MKIHTRWIYILNGIIIMMLLGTVYSYSIFRRSLEEIFELSTAESGLPYMAALGFYALFMFLSGKMIERYHPRHVLVFGGFLVSLGWILSYFASGVAHLVVTYGMITGAGVGIAYGVIINVVAKWFVDKRGFAVGLVLVGFGMSPLIVAPIVRELISNFGVMNTFLTLGLAYAVLIPVLAIPFRYPSENEVDRFDKIQIVSSDMNSFTTNEMVKSRLFKGLYINFIVGTMIGLMLIGLTFGIGTDYVGLNQRTVTAMISAFAIFNGMGRPFSGWLTEKLSPVKSMVISYGLIMVASVIMITTQGRMPVLYFVAFALFWFNLGSWLAIAPTTTILMFGAKNYSQNYSVVFTAYGIGAILGVLTSGIFIDIVKDYTVLFYYIFLLSLIGIFVSTTMLKSHRGRT
ncbi:MAG: OFA family MFS transporter [Erysipelothrix sp.]|nr:OFA family MFS transporter [Erysipelothrix sp.]